MGGGGGGGGAEGGFYAWLADPYRAHAKRKHAAHEFIGGNITRGDGEHPVRRPPACGGRVQSGAPREHVRRRARLAGARWSLDGVRGEQHVFLK